MKFAEWAQQKEPETIPDAKQFKLLACVLHAASQRELIRAGQRFSLENTGSLLPPHWTGKAHQMVVKYSPTIKDMKLLEAKFGKPMMIAVEAFAQDERCLAAIVKSPIETSQPIPFITIAHSPEVQSNYAKDMIKDRSLWKRFLEVDELYTYLLAIQANDSVWPETIAQLASASTLVK